MISAMEEVNVSIVDSCVLQQVAVQKGQRVTANQFICATNQKIDTYKCELENSILNGRDEYPATLADAAEVMDHRFDDTPHIPGSDGVAFVQAGENETGRQESDGQHAHIKCFKCGHMGHFDNQCPDQISQPDTTRCYCFVTVMPCNSRHQGVVG
jgi:sulfur relay (sulfurtransferase) DsrF/TusC family protein